MAPRAPKVSPHGRLVEEGIAAALTRKYNPNSARPRIFDGAAKAKLIALTCSPALEGFARWSLRRLEEKVVELNIVEKASDNTIGRTLKKRPQAPSQSAMGDPAGRQRRLRPAMEDVLETYQKPRDPDRPLVCLDETSKQLIVETRASIPDPDESSGTIPNTNTSETRGQYIHNFRAAGGLAPRQGHRPPRRRRLRAGAQGTVCRAFSRRCTNQAGPRQSEHAHARLALRGLSRARSAPSRPRKLRLSYPGLHLLAARRVAAKTIRLRDKEHCKLVATHPCVVCGRMPSDAHHIRFAQPRALGRKVSDEYTVPVCRLHYRELHRYGDEASWWAGSIRFRSPSSFGDAPVLTTPKARDRVPRAFSSQTTPTRLTAIECHRLSDGIPRPSLAY